MFKILFIALLLGVSAGVGAVYYEREVGPLPSVAQILGEEPFGTVEAEQPVLVSFGPPPNGDYQVDVTGNLNLGASSMAFNMDMTGTIGGSQSDTGVDIRFGIDDVTVEFLDQEISQPVDATIVLRYDNNGRLLSADMSGLDGIASPIPVTQGNELQYLAGVFVDRSFRVGDRIDFSQTETLDQYPGAPRVTVSGEAVAIETGRYQGRDTVTIDLTGQIVSSEVNGSFSGTSVVDLASGFVLDSAMSMQMDAPVEDREATIEFSMDFSTNI